jgi:hypothetical protein
MSRRTKFLSLTLHVLFLLACSTVTQPFKDVKNVASTVESFATAMPVDTLKALASEIPVSTLEALPSGMPNFQGYIDPQGTPAADWKGIPVMPQATAGEAAKDGSSYSFKVNTTIKEAEDFYKSELTKLGWTSSFSLPGNDTATVLAFQKDSDNLVVTIIDVNGSVVVTLTMA